MNLLIFVIGIVVLIDEIMERCKALFRIYVFLMNLKFDQVRKHQMLVFRSFLNLAASDRVFFISLGERGQVIIRNYINVYIAWKFFKAAVRAMSVQRIRNLSCYKRFTQNFCLWFTCYHKYWHISYLTNDTCLLFHYRTPINHNQVSFLNPLFWEGYIFNSLTRVV